MSDDWAEDAARLHDEVDKAARRFEDASTHIGPVSGSDSSGEVTVVLDEEGVIQDVRVKAIVGVAAGPFIAAAAVVAFLAAAYAGSLTLKSAAASANTQLRAKLDDSTAFPGGTWPSGVLH